MGLMLHGVHEHCPQCVYGMAHCVPPLQHKTAERDAGQVYKYDLSMPLRGMYGLVEAVRERVQQHGCGDTVKVTGFGHVGDGNLHLNISDGSRRPDAVRCCSHMPCWDIIVHHLLFQSHWQASKLACSICLLAVLHRLCWHSACDASLQPWCITAAIERLRTVL